MESPVRKLSLLKNEPTSGRELPFKLPASSILRRAAYSIAGFALSSNGIQSISVLPVPAADVCSVEAGFIKGQRISSGAYMIFRGISGVPKTHQQGPLI